MEKKNNPQVPPHVFVFTVNNPNTSWALEVPFL